MVRVVMKNMLECGVRKSVNLNRASGGVEPEKVTINSCDEVTVTVISVIP